MEMEAMDMGNLMDALNVSAAFSDMTMHTVDAMTDGMGELAVSTSSTPQQDPSVTLMGAIMDMIA